jgi:hypothetical protein
MVTGIVVEGVVAAGKTTLLNQLQRRLVEARPSCTKLVLSEHYTERVLEDLKAAGTLTSTEVVAHSSGVLGLIETLNCMKATSKFADNATNASIAVLVERWLGSHVANLAGMHRWEWSPDWPAFREIVRQCARLHQLGFRFLVLQVSFPQLRTRMERTLVHRNDEWRRYIHSQGGLDAAVERYAAWQDALVRFYDALPVPHQTVAVQDESDFFSSLAASLTNGLLLTPAGV